MKIAVNTRFLLPGQLEGFGWYTHEIMRRMVAQHPEAEFIFLFDRPFDARFVYGPNVTPLVLSPRARFAPLFLTWFEWSVPRALRACRADVFFSPDSMCSLSAKTPTLMTCHDLVPLQYPKQIPLLHRHFLLHFLPKWLRRADIVLTISDFIKDEIIHQGGIPEQRVAAVHNGCRDGFSPLNDAEKQATRQQYAAGQEYFFYTGAIHPRKNIPGLIRAFDRFKSDSGAATKLLLAGRFAWKTGDVLSAYEQARYRDDIHFLGYVDDAELARLMASALALVYVSLTEGFGLPLLEAMHAEVPAITSRAGALPEVAGDAALYVDPLDESDIARAMEKIRLDRAFGQALVEKGRLRREKFSWDRAAEQIWQLLLNLAEKSR